MRGTANILHLGIKELRSLWRDPALILLILYAFTLSVYISATAMPETPHRATIGIVDEDRSQASQRIIDAFHPPYFVTPQIIDHAGMDVGMDRGAFTFTLNIPPDFQRDLLSGKQPVVQLNIDATQVSQAFTGAGHIQQIIQTESRAFAQRFRQSTQLPVEAVVRSAYNPNLERGWFGSVTSVIDHITMLVIILTGAAVIREREHGTIEHLLVMPVTPLEIMLAKVWSMGLVVLLAAALSLKFVVNGWLGVPIHGSMLLFLLGATLHLFACSSIGIFFGTLARSMPQLGLLVILTLIPLMILSGALTPRESMPLAVQYVMLGAPTTHFVELAQSILFRGAGPSIVWPQLLALLTIGTLFFVVALSRLRRSLQ